MDYMELMLSPSVNNESIFDKPMTLGEVMNDLNVFASAVQMTCYEYAIYTHLGDQYCNDNNIDRLDDVVGESNALSFYRRKRYLILSDRINRAECELSELEQHILDLKEERDAILND